MKSKNRWAFITLTMMTAIVTGCNLNDNFEEPAPKPAPVDPGNAKPLILSPDEGEMVNQSNAFAFKLYM